MTFFETLQQATEQDRQYLLSTPLMGESLAGNVTLQTYVAYLCQAYHHVKHTVPLLMATGARFPESKEWLREAIAEYIDEEIGHQEWILNDIVACGYDREAARNTAPTLSNELMIAYAYDAVQRGNPLALFGMVHVLEGTSITSADAVAEALQKSLDLPDKAFSYLRSHGELDQEHVKFLRGLMDRIDSAEDQNVIVHSARVFYRLFGDLLRSVSAEQVMNLPANNTGTTHAA